MWLLGLKLGLTPLLIGLVSLAGRRWGPGIGGWLIGLPLTSGPVAFYLALEQGADFAANAALGTLAGLISLAAFCLAYVGLSFYLGWPGCWLLSWAVFLVATLLLQTVSLPLLPTFLLVIVCLALTAWLLTLAQAWATSSASPATTVAPRYELLWRMLIATGFVLLLTLGATVLGPRLSGLLAPFPIFATILTIFTHRLDGPQAARRLLRGVALGAFGFAIFFTIVAGLVQPAGLLVAFGCALLGTGLTQFISLRLVRRQPAS